MSPGSVVGEIGGTQVLRATRALTVVKVSGYCPVACCCGQKFSELTY
jgi:hypothetical protein